MHKRWWQLRDNALEIFLTNGRTLLLAFDNTKVGSGLMSQHSPPAGFSPTNSTCAPSSGGHGQKTLRWPSEHLLPLIKHAHRLVTASCGSRQQRPDVHSAITAARTRSHAQSGLLLLQDTENNCVFERFLSAWVSDLFY